MDDSNKNIIFLVVAAILIFILFGKKIREGFYHYYAPSNCMETVFGNTVCYPPYYFPFFTGTWF